MLDRKTFEFGFVFSSPNCHIPSMTQPQRLARSVIILAFAIWVFGGTALEAAAAQTLKLTVHQGYLSGVPLLVRVEVLNSRGEKDRSLWNSQATLSVDHGGIALSTNRVVMRN